MGEFATYRGASIKIGTCEDMLYLRADQIHLVTPERNSIDPARERESVRFRFPFPDEDGVEPGQFDPPDRGVTVWGLTAPGGVDHGMVQFSHRNGYLVSLPCPEGTGANPFRVHRNGFGGATELVQQRFVGDALVPVLGCKGCGVRWRLETPEDAEPLVRLLRDDSVRPRAGGGFMATLAARVESGFTGARA